jgi:hypothetical protein
MYKRLLLSATLFASAFSAARDKAETWYEVRSQHFVVVSNSSDKQARRVAEQFERMRAVFHRLFPHDNIDPSTPIMVLAIRDQKDFRALEPAAYLTKGSLELGGLFLRGPDKNYVLMRLDAEGDHPYSVVYHEYTHLLLSKIDRLPLWLNEGIAEFYQTTEINDKDVLLGKPSQQDLQLLRQYQLLPLPVLFKVDQTSPYYHEETKGSIFYGESWVLTHYLETKDVLEKTHRVGDYVQLIDHDVDPVTAATQAFGDLKQLQSSVEAYVRQLTFSYFKLPGVTSVDVSTFQSRELPGPQADADRADFLAYNQRTADAKALADHVLHEDPNNVLARETMGFIAAQEHNLEEAHKWYSEAVKLDSQSFLAHYYFAAISMNAGADADESQIENSLRASIKLNPQFAPSYDRLAVLLAQHHKNLDEARLMALTAVQLEPENLGYRINTANVMMQLQRPDDAIRVLQNAMHLAKTPDETRMVEDFLLHASEYSEALARGDAVRQIDGQDAKVTTHTIIQEEADTEQISRDQPLPKGAHRTLTGLLTGVTCLRTAMDLQVMAAGKKIPMHSNNYFNVQYSVLGFDLKKDLNPCADLDGRRAKVEYIESEVPNGPAALVAIEIHK